MEEEYDPAANRIVKSPRNYFETMLLLLKVSSGAGILAMPKGFAEGGFCLGVLGTLFLGLICGYCFRTLVSVQYELCRRKKIPALTYAQTAALAFKEGPLHGLAPCMKGISQIFLIGAQLGAASIYMVVLSYHVHQMIEYFFPIEYEIRFYLLMSIIPFLLLALVNRLEYIAVLSFAADIASIVAYGIILYYVMTGFDDGFLPKEKPFKSFLSTLLYIGTVIFTMEPIALALRLEHDMKNPRRFTSTFGVANVTLLLMTVSYVLFGYFGYLKYGDTVRGSITLSLPIEDTKITAEDALVRCESAPVYFKLLAQFCKILVSFAMFIGYGLALFVTYDIIWIEYFVKKKQFQKPNSFTYSYQYFIRVILIMLTLIFSMLIPNIELFIALIGCLCIATTGIAFPALFNLFCYWNFYYGGEFVTFIIWCVFIIILGFFAFFIGVPVSIYYIINVCYWNDDEEINIVQKR